MLSFGLTFVYLGFGGLLVLSLYGGGSGHYFLEPGGGQSWRCSRLCGDVFLFSLPLARSRRVARDGGRSCSHWSAFRTNTSNWALPRSQHRMWYFNGAN